MSEANGTSTASTRIDCITDAPAPVQAEALAATPSPAADRESQQEATIAAGRTSQTILLKDASVQTIYTELLGRMTEDPTRDGLLRTPERVEKSMAFLTRGYHQTIENVLHSALFDVDYDEMVIVRDIEFYSLCEHHLLPFFGRAHIAYVPNGKVVGLSKLPRLVDMFSRRLQVQERLTREIAEALVAAIHPQGVGVILEAQHLCMMMRGVEKQSSVTTTSAMLGVFRTGVQTRNEFLSLVRRPNAGF